MDDLALNCQTVSAGTHCLHPIDVMHLVGNSFWVSKWWLVTMWLWESHCAKSEVRNTSMPFTLNLSSRVSHLQLIALLCPFEVRDFMLLGKKTWTTVGFWWASMAFFNRGMLSTFVKAARLQAEAATAENCSFYLKVLEIWRFHWSYTEIWWIKYTTLPSLPTHPPLQVKYVVWTGYPVAYLLRSANLLTYWQEEVLCYTTLDPLLLNGKAR